MKGVHNERNEEKKGDRQQKCTAVIGYSLSASFTSRNVFMTKDQRNEKKKINMFKFGLYYIIKSLHV